MIVIKIEVWPLGDPCRARELGRAVLANDGQGDADVGHYDGAICKSAALGAKSPGVWKAGRIINFPRRSKVFGPWDLVRAFLNAALIGRPQFESAKSNKSRAARIERAGRSSCS